MHLVRFFAFSMHSTAVAVGNCIKFLFLLIFVGRSLRFSYRAGFGVVANLEMNSRRNDDDDDELCTGLTM